MLNIGMGELFVVAILGLVVIGPDRLPEVMRTMGRAYAKVKNATKELRQAFQLEVDKVEAEHRAELIRMRRELMQTQRDAKRALSLNEPQSRPERHAPPPPPKPPKAPPIRGNSDELSSSRRPTRGPVKPGTFFEPPAPASEAPAHDSEAFPTADSAPAAPTSTEVNDQETPGGEA